MEEVFRAIAISPKSFDFPRGIREDDETFIAFRQNLERLRINLKIQRDGRGEITRISWSGASTAQDMGILKYAEWVAFCKIKDGMRK